ncbi:MAG: protein kinase, partial [Polyangia bacterium]
MAHSRYTIVGKLADGGMAEIFLAMQHGAEGFQKPVVLKRVLTAFSADPQFRNMFLDEAQISMSLNHGNIVQVLDVGVAGERTFLVLELIEGWDLERVMERAQATGPEHPWPPSLALYVTAQICRGLGYAHAKHGPDGRPLGIVHRDVSPTNVLISEQGEVKLADFGIAKAERKREQTLAGVIKGKIGFMSPEQVLGRPLDARADLFSVGTVMYLMLTGRKPFDAGSELESMTLAQRAEYRPPEELNPYLSPDATAIVRRAMEREPAQRYQTADQMLVDVERVLRGQYHSAGQTELKLWLTELARRDGVLPIGRVPREDGATPMFVDQSGELSAGASLQLSDMDASTAAASAAAATAVALPVVNLPGATPPPQSAAGLLRVPTPPREGFRVVPGGPVTTPPLTPRPGATPAGRDAAAEPPGHGGSWPPGDAAGAATPSPSPSGPRVAAGPLLAPRLPRRGRVGLGFVLGAVCMLGTVFGIRWLAQWAGRERHERHETIGGITHWYPSNPDSRAAAPEGAARAPTPLAVNSDASAAGLDGGAATAAGARGAPAG